MQASSDESETQRLLAQLDSQDASVRREAAKAALAHEPRDERILEKLKDVAADDPDPAVRWSAAKALLQAGIELPEETWQKVGPPIAPATPGPTAIKWLGFLIGFAGWFLMNAGLWLLLLSLTVSQITLVLVILALPANLILLSMLALIKQTRWMALGVLSALALNLVITLVLGLFANAICGIPFFIKKGLT